MTGLRDRKKQEMRHRIISEAATLFAEKGIDATTMEEVAAASDVSVGTVYNYFGTKRTLLLAGIGEDTDRMVEAGQAIIETPGDDVVSASKRLVRLYLDDLVSWDKRLLREIFGAAFQRVGGVDLTGELAEMDQKLIEQGVVLLSHFKQRGQLADGVEVYDAAMIIFSVFVLQLFMYMNLDIYEISDLQQQVDRQIELVFAGLRSK